MSGDLSNRPSDIVAILRSGAAYYREAAERAEHSGLKEWLLRNSEARDLIAEELSSTAGTCFGALSQATIAAFAYHCYLEAKTLIEGTEYALLADLCDSEDRSLAELGAAPVDQTPLEAGGLTEQHVRD